MKHITPSSSFRVYVSFICNVCAHTPQKTEQKRCIMFCANAEGHDLHVYSHTHSGEEVVTQEACGDTC